MTRLITSLSLACVTLAGSACAHISVDAPEGFAQLDKDDDYAYRATNAEGVVLGLRRERNDPSGDLAFWSGAVDAQLRRQGYTALSASDVKSADGILGRQIRYVVELGGRDHAFWATVFVTKKSVVTVEAGGDVAYFPGQENAIERSIAALEIGGKAPASAQVVTLDPKKAVDAPDDTKS